MDVCVQVHKRINGCSPGYVIVLLVFNSDINNRKTEIAPLTWSVLSLSVKLKGGGGRTFGVRTTRLWNTAVPNSLIKEIILNVYIV